MPNRSVLGCFTGVIIDQLLGGFDWFARVKFLRAGMTTVLAERLASGSRTHLLSGSDSRRIKIQQLRLLA